MSKQHNRYIGLYDKPLSRDGVAWYTAALVPLRALVLAFPTEGSTEQTIGSAIAGFFLTPLFFGVPVALIRRFVRALRMRPSTEHRGTDSSPAVMPADASTEDSDNEFSAEGRSGYGRPPEVHDPEPRVAPPSARAVESAAAAEHQLSGLLDVTPIGKSRELTDHWDRKTESLPFPIARSARALGSTSNPSEQYTRLLDCAEATTVVVGIVATPWLVEHDSNPKAVRDLLGRYRRTGVTFGTWLPIIDRFVENARQSSDRFGHAFAAGLSDGAFGTSARAILGERNRNAHGGHPRSKGAAALRISELEPHLAAMLSSLDALSSSKGTAARVGDTVVTRLEWPVWS